MHLIQYPKMGCLLAQQCRKTVPVSAVRHALPTYQESGRWLSSPDLHRSTGAEKGQRCALQQVSIAMYIYISTAKPQT